MTKRFSSVWWRRSLAALGFSLLTIFLYALPFGQQIEESFQDFWFQIRGEIPPPSDVVIVAMDEESYRNLKLPTNAPWPRRLHANLLEKLAHDGARSVTFDILFEDPGRDGPEVDAAFARAMKMLPTTIGAEVNVVQDPNLSYSNEVLYKPLNLFSKSAKVGVVNMPDVKGILRRMDLAVEGVPYLPLATWLSLKPADSIEQIADYGIPYINFYGPARMIRTVSYDQALDPKALAPDFFKGKSVFIGLMLRSSLGPAQKDSFLTPFSGDKATLTYGVEIHATVFANLETGSLLYRFPSFLEILLLAILSIGSTLLIWSLPPLRGLFVTILLALSWVAAGYLCFRFNHLIVGSVWMFVTLPLSYTIVTLSYYLTTYRQQQRILKALELYVSPEIARQLAHQPNAMNVGGKTVVATAMFTDLKSFSTIAESMSPSGVADMLVTYFTDMTEVVLAKRGTVIKFIGDAIFALWNAPLEQPDHAAQAVQAALDLQEAGDRLNARALFPKLITRCGVHTGPMMVGNFGSSRRFDYTALGDSVNLAARLEGLNKYFGTRILISGDTRRLLPDNFYCWRLGSTRVVGKQEAVMLFTVLSAAEKEAWEKSSLPQCWPELLEAYEQANWSKVIALSQKFESELPQFQTLFALYRQLAEDYSMNPPPTPWRGEIIFESK